MHLKIILVVILAALVAAGLGYGLLNLKDRNVEKSVAPPEQVAVAPAPAPGTVMPPPAMQAPLSPVSPPGAPPLAAQPPRQGQAQGQLGQPGQPLPIPPGQPGQPGMQMLAPMLGSPGSTMPPVMAGTPASGMPIPVPGSNPDKEPPLPPLALLQMPTQSKQDYFDRLLKIDGKQKDMSSYYFTSLLNTELLYRQLAMRQMDIIHYTSGMQMGNMAGMLPPADPALMMRTLEEQQKELTTLQDQIKKTIEARKVLIESLSKEQAAKIKPYVDAKVY